jgi:hypothetical protein
MHSATAPVAPGLMEIVVEIDAEDDDSAPEFA